MGGTAERVGTGILTGGLSELDRAGLGPSAVLGGGGGKGSKAPSAPDFVSAAREEADLARRNTNEQTAANRPNQAGPFGSSTWSQGPDGSWSNNISLAGPLASGASGLMGQIGSQGPIGTGDQAREQAITSAYNSAASRLDPQWAQTEESTRAQLANQGLDPGSEAYNNEMGNLGRAKTDAYAQAMANAIGQGTAAQGVTFNQNLQSAMAPYQQLGMLQGLSQPAGFVAAGRSAEPNLMGAYGNAYQGALNQYGIQQSGKNSMMSGAAQLAPLAIKLAAL